MADPVLLKSDEQRHGHIDRFMDDEGAVATVDAPPVWSVSETTGDPPACTLVVSPDGMDVDVISMDMQPDDPPRTATLTMSAKEGGVEDAIVMTWDVIVSSLSSPLATGAAVIFGAPTKK